MGVGLTGRKGWARAGVLPPLALAVALAPGCSPAEAPPPAPPGAAVYARYCAGCHGPEGDGRGPAAYLLFPKPRNFKRGDFKLRSTPQGLPPTDEDLVRTIRDGIPGTSMFAFGELLGDAEIRQVVEYLRELSPPLQRAPAPTPGRILTIPTAPEPSRELVAAGRRAYEVLQCGQCHGPQGRGDGPSAPTLRDSEGDPFPPSDLTRGIYKSGGSPEALYRTLLTGMAGTPMPSYQAALESERQAWALVYYLLSLAPGGRARPTRGDPGPVPVAAVGSDAGLADPDSGAWDALPGHRVYLRPLWHRSRYPLFATLKVARTPEGLYVRAEWEDPSHDARALATEEFPDGVALQWAVGEPPPFIGMGGGGDAGEVVEIWYWRAERQLVADQGQAEDITDLHPGLTVDRYPFARVEGDGDSPATYGVQGSPFLPGRDLGNPLAAPPLLRRPVHTLLAGGIGSLTAPPPARMRAEGRGSWSDGVYRVVFHAPLGVRDPGLEVDLGRPRVAVALAVWDGSAGDRDGTKLVSQWVFLEPR